ncbi:MAG: hypothetical protein STSR0008_19770 [Ignavibacterium sp.]
MDNIFEKLKDDLGIPLSRIGKLSKEEREKILIQLRDEVDLIDKEIVKLLSKRTLHSILIGRIKRSLGLPTYSPEREKDVSEKISSYVEEPLKKEAILRIYERILDESRAIQKEEKDKGNINLWESSIGVPFSEGMDSQRDIPSGKVDDKTSQIYKHENKNKFMGINSFWKNLLSKKEFLIVLFFFFFVFGFLGYIFFSPNYYNVKSPVVVEVRKGASLNQVVDSLYQKKIIPNKFNFKLAALFYGAEKRIKPARYKIPNGLSYIGLLDLLVSGKGDQLKSINLYGGITTKGIANKLQNEGIIKSDSFINFINETKIWESTVGVSAFGGHVPSGKTNSLEGYLLPTNYDFYENSSPQEIIDSMINRMKIFFVDELINQTKQSGLTIHQVLSLASIVNGETKNADEMPIIAGVYLNRLKRGMKLQADPTIQYLQQNGWKRLSYNDLKIDSPYNTYKYFGLPPGPINNPGKEAILSVLYPQKHNYLFFVADGKGKHKFAETFTQHKIYAREYYKWLNSQNKN